MLFLRHVMMHIIPSFSLLLLLLCSHFSIAKRGGGGSHGSSGDSDSGSSSSGGSDSGSLSSGSSDSGSSSSGSSSSGSTSSTTPQKCTFSQCDCARIDQRRDIYQLPASYYNGTLTITHQLSSNSAWDAAALHGGSGCAADDGQNKTYSYPALFAVGPNLNTADTNLIFWNLRAYPPVTKTQAQADVLVEFVHIRSADFAPGYGFSAGDEDSSYPSQTHTYWDTKIRLSAGAKTWDADVEYIAQPKEETAFVGATNSALKYRSSNYVTLTDICDYGQQFILGASRGFPPTSPIPENVDRQNTFPTFFLNLGVKATVRGIGNDSLAFEMGSRVDRQVVGVGTTNLCLGSSSPGAFYRTITALQWEKADRSSTTTNMYNISATYTLSFEGQIVRENSTTIFPNSTAVPQWDIQSKVSKTASSSTSSSTSRISSSAVRPVLSSRVLYILPAAFFWHLLGL